MKDRRLPIGIDLGAGRVRALALSLRSDDSFRLIGAGGADVENDPAAALESALEQVSTPERRCIAMIRSSEASLHTVVLPPMSRREANRTARFEALAASGISDEVLIVRSVTIECNARGERRMLIAATPSSTVRQTLSLLKSAGLRTIRVDHEGCALTRACKGPLLDIGLARSSLIAQDRGAPLIRTFAIGGIHFTKAMARDYGIAEDLAEIRKCTIGLGGAAKDVLDAYIAALGAEVEVLREIRTVDVRSIRFCGNGSRLIELRDAIERELHICMETARFRDDLVTDLPVDVQQSAAIDCFSAFAAALPANA